ncbi:hypothetical protein V5O48_012620 [Marasmius crinis-equi]|uniref:Sulfotransferase n=1 Tax=Marasmius crinis-equi TaxID=585013 RepID=A0ABR3F2B7_9AGAR
MSSQPQPLRLWICSHPRTCSNLLFRHFEGTENLEFKRYAFLDAFYSGPERQTAKPIETCSILDKEVRMREGKTFQDAVDEYAKWIEEVEGKRRIPTLKDHGFVVIPSETVNQNISEWEASRRQTSPRPKMSSESSSNMPNPTLWPYSLLSTFTVVITIRHPARTLASYAEINARLGVSTIQDEDLAMIGSMKWQRMIFDACSTQQQSDEPNGNKRSGLPPVIVDGDRLVSDSRGVMEKLYQHLGLDVGTIGYSWESIEDIEWPNERVKAGMEKVFSSTGVIPNADAVASVDLEEEKVKWTLKWGEECATRMMRLVQFTLEDYEYLLARSL